MIKSIFFVNRTKHSIISIIFWYLPSVIRITKLGTYSRCQIKKKVIFSLITFTRRSYNISQYDLWNVVGLTFSLTQYTMSSVCFVIARYFNFCPHTEVSENWKSCNALPQLSSLTSERIAATKLDMGKCKDIQSFKQFLFISLISFDL